jgi:AhpD family alkylhydroperoxidase
MQLDEMIQCLIAVGASIGVDCKPCIQSCIALARGCGADEQEIEAAMTIGKKVKECAGKMADSLKEESSAVKNGSTTCCGSTEINT